MARTFRRTRDTHLFERYQRDTVRATSKYGGVYWTEVDVGPEDPSYRWNWLHVHTDNHSGAWNAPGGFRRALGRSFRRNAEQRLIRALRQEEQDVVLPRFYRNANWIWF